MAARQRRQTTKSASNETFNSGSDETDFAGSDEMGIIENISLQSYPVNRDEKLIERESVFKRNVAIVGGLLDVALLTEDVEKLKFIIEAGRADVKHYDIVFWSLSVSLGLKVRVYFCFLN